MSPVVTLPSRAEATILLMFGGRVASRDRLIPRVARDRRALRHGVLRDVHCTSLVEPRVRFPPVRNAEGPQARPFIIWWRRRESNPRPKTLHSRDYMLSLVIVLSPRRH